jgi:hypothetical protein
MYRAQGKIVDIRTGNQAQSDETFLDAMLDKVNRLGEGSLTWKEKLRMQRISKQKRL